MPIRNKLDVLKKAYILTIYAKDQNEIADCLLYMEENEKDVMSLDKERREKNISWEEMYHEKITQGHEIEVFNFNPQAKLQRVY